MSKKLYNSLIDFLVVVGSDQETGLVLKNESREENLSIEDCVFEPSVLAVLSFDVASYPSSQIKFNWNYAQEKILAQQSVDTIDENMEINTMRKSIFRRPTVKAFDTPIQPDILQNLPQFCFPREMTIKKFTEEPTVHSFVLTDIEGKKKYAVVLNFLREFYCCESDKDEIDDNEAVRSDFQLIGIENEDETEAHKNYFHVYVPTSIVLISKFSYFTVLKECVSSIHYEIDQDTSNFRQIIEKYAINLTHLPIAPISINRFSLSVEFSLPTKDVLISSQDEFGYEIFDISLSLIFQRISLDNIIQIILLILAESKIVFISNHDGLLTPSIQCFLKLIQPFKWSLPFVPFLPTTQLEYIEAPHPFIIGCNINDQFELIQSNDLYIINLDDDSITTPKESSELIQFPENDLAVLKEDLSAIDFDLVQARKFTTASKMDLKSTEYNEKRLIQELNSTISEAFIDFFVRIYGDLYPYFKPQTKSFNKKSYLDSVDEQSLSFYKQVLDTVMFEVFVNDLIKCTCEHRPNLYIDRLNKLMNNGSVLSRRESLENPAYLRNGISDEITHRLSTLTHFAKPTNKILKIPIYSECTYGGHEIISLLTKELEMANLLSYKDCLLYLRGLYYVLLNKLVDGFRDFYSIESNNLFPKQLIQDEIYANLSQTQKEYLKEQDFYRTTSEFKKICDDYNNKFQTSITSVDLNMHEYEYVEDFSFQGFSKRLEQLEIRIEPKMVERLFKSLTLEESDEYDMETFEIFLETYQSKEEELNRINKYLPKRALRSIEFAVKISARQNVPGHGIGLVVLSQQCLYFLEQGTHKIILLTELKNIVSIEKTVYKSNLFNSKMSLKISYVNLKEFSQLDNIYLCLESEVNVWYILIQELCYAYKFSKQLLDKSLIQYAAKNVLLTDAILASGLNLLTIHSKNLAKAASYLCYFSNLNDTNPRRFSSESTQALRYRINPSSRDSETMSVESMVYVEIQEYPTVWCAIGNRIRIYDGITWDEQLSDLKASGQINCLFYDTNESKAWIGTKDKCLYVIDVETREFNKKLERHSSSIISLTLFKKLNWMISGGLNGEILVWDSKKLEHLNTHFFHDPSKKFISFLASENYLIKCYSQEIQIYDEDFNSIKTLEYRITPNDLERNQTISCTCISYSVENEELLWIGDAKYGIICIWSLVDFEMKMRVAIECQGLTTMINIDEMIWVGSKEGKITMLCSKTFEVEKTFEAHKDSVKSLCGCTNKNFIVSGSDSKDGTIAVWNSSRGAKKTIYSALKKLLSNHILESSIEETTE